MEDSYDGYISRREILECCDRLDRIAVGTQREVEAESLITSAVKATTKAVRRIVLLATTQDVVPAVRAKWEKRYNSYLKCSNCHEPYSTVDVCGCKQSINFCPHCGARMDGDE